MRDVIRCFVRGAQHLTCQRHRTEKISISIGRLEAKHPTTLLTVDDLAEIYVMDETDNEVNDDNDLVDYVEWGRTRSLASHL